MDYVMYWPLFIASMLISFAMLAGIGLFWWASVWTADARRRLRTARV